MGWAEQLPSGKWRAIWRDDLGRRRSRGPMVSQAAAKRFAGEQESKARRGEATVSGRCPTWGEWLPVWQRLRVIEASTSETDEIRINRHILPAWGEVRLNKISRAQVQMWVNELAETEAWSSSKDAKRAPRPVSAATVERVYNLFAASLAAAVRHDAIPLGQSPCRGIELPVAGEGHERYLSRAEFDLAVHHLNEPYRTAAAILVGTGARFGEFAGLHWQRVDLERAVIDIVETWDPASRTVKPYTKGKRRRTVPIPGWLLPVLTDQLERTGGRDSCGLPHAGTVHCRSGLVVPGVRGAAFDDHNFGRRQWATAVRLAGIGHVRLHDLRHTYASWLVQATPPVPIQEVQRLLGHASITTTMRYAHLGVSQDELVRAALG